MIKKIIIVLLVSFIAIVSVLFLAKDVIAKLLLQSGVRSFTGLQVSVDIVNVDFFNNKIYLKGVRVSHPEGFVQEEMVVMPEVYIEYDLAAFFSGKAHLKEVRLYIEKLAIVRNNEGKLNIKAVQETAKKTSRVGASSTEKKTEPKPLTARPKMVIDVLTIKLGSVSYNDYSNSGLILSGTVNVNSQERYENISSQEQLLEAIFGSFAKGGFGGFDIKGSFSEIKENFDKMGDNFKKEFKAIGDSFKKMFSQGEEK